MKILITKHDSVFKPGFISELLESSHISYDAATIDSQSLYPDFQGYNAVINLAGAGCANDQTQMMESELTAIRAIVKNQIPYLGICLGHQTLVKAMGGDVYTNKVGEIGWTDNEGDPFEIRLTEEGMKDPLFAGAPHSFPMFQCHNDAVSLTQDMVNLATGKYTKVQAVRIGKNAYGTQFHLEVTPEMLVEWIIKEPRLSKLDKEQLNNTYKEVKETYEQARKIILQNFLHLSSLT